MSGDSEIDALEFVGWLQHGERENSETIARLRESSKWASQAGLTDLAVAMTALSYSFERYDRELTRAAVSVLRNKSIDESR